MIPVNFSSLIIAGIWNLFIGFLWYGPIFGKPWMRLVGIDPSTMKDTKGMGTRYATAFVAAVIIAWGINFVTTMSGAHTALMGARIGIMLWLAFVATTFIGTVLWENRPTKLYYLNIGYYLVSFAGIGAIVTLVR